MALRPWIRARLQDWAMRQMNELRPGTVGLAEGRVLEIGFGTGINLAYYGPGVTSLVGIDPNFSDGFAATDERIAGARFPVERLAARADQPLPFESGEFDCAVSTWTLCTIPQHQQALSEVRRLLRPGGRFLFVEHGRAEAAGTARWQDRLDPYWCRFADGCHMNRAIDHLVEEAGFRLASLDRFLNRGPRLLAHMYRGVAERRD